MRGGRSRGWSRPSAGCYREAGAACEQRMRPFGAGPKGRRSGLGWRLLQQGSGAQAGASVAEGETWPDCGSYLQQSQHGFSDDLNMGEGEKSG